MCVASRIGLVAILLAACTAPEDVVSQEVVAGKTVVSLTFDDTGADNFQVGALTEARGMRATFFVNSGRVGQSGSLSLQQLIAREDAGHEIAGHTITHAHLTAISEDEARREICNDRASLLEAGFRITSFAYPFSDQDEAVQQIVRDCGYNSARLVGGLVMPTSCSGCPYANPQAPPNPYAVRTNDSVDETTTLDRMKLYVTQAEQHGGGWVPMVFHHVCDGCNELSISPAMLAEFLDWLRARESIGTVVATVDQGIGGSVKPAVPGPIETSGGGSGDMIQNASLETDANRNQVPDCWQRGGSGSNSATYSLTSNAYDGSAAQRIDVTSLSSGARRLVTLQDSGTCAPPAIAGHRYTVTARYISNTQPVFTIYARNASGTWSFLAQSPALPAASSYALGTYTTPAMPSGTTAISVGLSIIRVGSLTMDSFTLVDTAGGGSDTTAPSVSLTAPASGSTVSGVVQVSANATDAGGVARVELFANGTRIATDPTYPYWFAWDTSAFAGRSVTLAVRAVDLAGNTATSSSRTVNVTSAADTTPPTVALTSPSAGATVSGSVQVTATASDAGGIARVEVYANATLVGRDATRPYTVTGAPAASAGTNVSLTARAFDNAGNASTSAARQVTVAAPADTTPPSVTLTSPANGATVSGTVTLSADATDAGGIARVELFAGTTLIATELDAPYSIAWDTTPYAGTTVSLTARAIDNAGNATTSAARTVTVQAAADTTPPAITLTSPADGATVSGGVQMAADASDAGGIDRVEFFVNDAFMGDVRTPPYVLTWNTETYAGTTATVMARAFDSAGNAAMSATHTVTVAAPTDTTAPTVALTSPANGATVSGTVTLAADAADASGIARVEFYGNGTLIATELNAPYELAWDTSPFAGTTVTLTARAVDSVGNDAMSAPRTITVEGAADTTPPAVGVTSPAAGSTVSGTVTVAADASDAGGIARVEFFANGSSIGSDTSSPYAISWDTTAFAGTTVTLTARAVDSAGNATTSAARTVTVAGAGPTNLIQNPSLESDSNGDQVPDCWQRGGSGTNSGTFTLTSNAFTGVRAQRIDVTSYTSGARRIVTRQDSGACAPSAVAGHRYTVTAHYLGNVAPVFTIYYRNASGSWVWFAQSPAQAASSSYRLGTYTTAPLPAGATHISVGLSIISLGSLTMDDFTLVDAGL